MTPEWHDVSYALNAGRPVGDVLALLAKALLAGGALDPTMAVPIAMHLERLGTGDPVGACVSCDDFVPLSVCPDCYAHYKAEADLLEEIRMMV